MGKLPCLSAKMVIKKLENIGYFVIRQKGSHIRMANGDKLKFPITIPNHGNKNVSKGVLRKILRDANLTVDEFNNL